MSDDPGRQQATLLIAALSPREIEILTLLGGGASNYRIARRLQISERTVKAHVTSILVKLGLESRLQAGLFAVTAGISEFVHPKPVAQRSHREEPMPPTDS